MNNAKDIAEKILNCKTYDIPDIQSLASDYLELEKEHQKINCGYCGKEFDREWSELQEHIKVCELHPVFSLKSEITKLKEENETLSKDLKMCREIGVEMQREVNRKLSTKYEKSIEALKKIKDLDYRGNRSSESIMAFNILNELGEL